MKQHFSIPTQSGQDLQAMVISNDEYEGKRPTILVIHGWNSEMARYPSRFQKLIDQGYLVFFFDLRGHGTTGGDVTQLSINDHFQDCLDAYDFMIGLDAVNTDDIAVFGSSYGGYMAVRLSAERPVDHLVLNVPAIYPDQIMDSPKMQRSDVTTEFRKVHHSPQENVALAAMNAFTGDMLLIQAEFDEFVPGIVIEDYLAAAQVEYTHHLLKGSDHSMKTPGANQERIEVMTEWFKNLS